MNAYSSASSDGVRPEIPPYIKPRAGTLLQFVPWPAALMTAGAGTVIGAGATVIYIRRRDWLRASICALLTAGCVYGIYVLLTHYQADGSLIDDWE
jgi:hypothetical protein